MDDFLKKKTRRNDQSKNEILNVENNKENKDDDDDTEEEDEVNSKSSEENDEKIFYSHEGFKNKKIIDLKDFQGLENLSNIPQPKSNDSLFKIKEDAKIYFNENKYNIESINDLDDTNPIIKKNI